MIRLDMPAIRYVSDMCVEYERFHAAIVINIGDMYEIERLVKSSLGIYRDEIEKALVFGTEGIDVIFKNGSSIAICTKSNYPTVCTHLYVLEDSLYRDYEFSGICCGNEVKHFVTSEIETPTYVFEF